MNEMKCPHIYTICLPLAESIYNSKSTTILYPEAINQRAKLIDIPECDIFLINCVRGDGEIGCKCSDHDNKWDNASEMDANDEGYEPPETYTKSDI